MRTGIIGADFRSLDIKMIGAIDVEVGLLDKLIHQNTGSIRFGSMSSPINNQTGGGVVFASITNPYETYKKLKNTLKKVNQIHKKIRIGGE